MIFIGVDIGSLALKAVSFKKMGKSFQTLKTHFFPISMSLSEEKKSALRLKHLKTLKGFYENRESRYIFCLPQNEVSAETLVFPFKERYKILKSLPYQMEEKLCLFDQKSLISDIRPADFLEGKRYVVVFSGFKDRIAQLLKDLESVGLRAFILTCEASAIANLFERPEREKKDSAEKAPPSETALYLKIGHTHTTALFFVGHQLRRVCSFEWGVSACIRKIALKYEISFSKAQEEFIKKAFILTDKEGLQGSQIEFSKMIEGPFQALIDKVRLLLLQIEGEEHGRCQKILLCGGGSEVRNLQTLFALHLRHPVSRVESSCHLPGWNFRLSDKKQNHFITALGAGLEGLRRSASPGINFLKEEFAPRFNPLPYIFSKWKEPLVLGLSSLLLFSIYASFRYNMSEELKTQAHSAFKNEAQRRAGARPGVVSLDRVRDFIDKKKARSLKLRQMEDLLKAPSALDKLKNLSSAIKQDKSWNLEIQELRITGDRVEIKGELKAHYLSALRGHLKTLAFKGELQSMGQKNPLLKKADPSIQVPFRKIEDPPPAPLLEFANIENTKNIENTEKKKSPKKPFLEKDKIMQDGLAPKAPSSAEKKEDSLVAFHYVFEKKSR